MNFWAYFENITLFAQKLLISRPLNISFVRMGKYAVEFVCTNPYEDQKPGTSGLRKPTRRFLDNKYYTENFIQVKISEISPQFNPSETPFAPYLNTFHPNFTSISELNIIFRVFSQQ